jgi:hypothetical protein
VQGRTEEVEAISDCRSQKLTFDETHVSGARTLLGFLDREVDALAFSKQLEYRAPHGTAMKEVFESGFVANEPEALVD